MNILSLHSPFVFNERSNLVPETYIIKVQGQEFIIPINPITYPLLDVIRCLDKRCLTPTHYELELDGWLNISLDSFIPVYDYMEIGYFSCSSEKLFDILNIATFLPLNELKQMVINRIAKDFIFLTETPEFYRLSPNALIDLLAADSLVVFFELDVFSAALRWSLVNCQSATTFPEIFDEIRWLHMPSQMLQQCYDITDEVMHDASFKADLLEIIWVRQQYELGVSWATGKDFETPPRSYIGIDSSPNIYETLRRKLATLLLDRENIISYDNKPNNKSDYAIIDSTPSSPNVIFDKGSKAILPRKIPAKRNAITNKLGEKTSPKPPKKCEDCRKILEKCVCKKEVKAKSKSPAKDVKTKKKVEDKQKEVAKPVKAEPKPTPKKKIETANKTANKIPPKTNERPITVQVPVVPKIVEPPKVTKETVKIEIEPDHPKAEDRMVARRFSNIPKNEAPSKHSQLLSPPMKERRKSSVKPIQPLEPDKTLADTPPMVEMHIDAPLLDILTEQIICQTKLTDLYLIGSNRLKWSDPITDTPCINLCWKQFYSQGWTPIKGMPEARSNHTVCAMYGEIYVIGGKNTTNQIVNDTIAYTAITDTWRPIEPMITPRFGCAAAEYLRQLFVIGGFVSNHDGTALTLTNSIEVYDPFEKIWKPANPFNKPICYAGLCESNGSFYLIGGATGTDPQALAPCNEIYRYNYEYDVWQPLTQLRIPRYKFGVLSIGKYINIVNGIGLNNEPIKSIEKWNTALEIWDRETACTEACEVNSICASLRGQIKAEVWDIPWPELKLNIEKLKLDDKILGQGHFGMVKKGSYKWDNKEELMAVKMLKAAGAGSNPLEEQKMFIDSVRELNIMSKIGVHNNIVNTIGALINKGMLYICTEFCPNGDLKGFLNKAKNFDGECSVIDMIGFAWGIALGMAHLADHGIIHRDLAARNILLAEGNLPKVCDFGLAKDEGIYQRKVMTGREDYPNTPQFNNILVSSGQVLRNLPIKWLALECLTHVCFSQKSDVWAFGVTLWEIVTLGDGPYPGWNNMEAKAKIQEGYRMPKPAKCLDELYDMMVDCWKASPDERPTFDELAIRLEELYKKELEITKTSKKPVKITVKVPLNQTDNTKMSFWRKSTFGMKAK